MDFASAVDELVKAHWREISDLQCQINPFQDLPTASSTKSFDGKLPDLFPEEHHIPLSAPHIGGASTPRRRAITTPRNGGPGTPAEPESTNVESVLEDALETISRSCSDTQSETNDEESHLPKFLQRWNLLTERLVVSDRLGHFVVHPGWRDPDWCESFTLDGEPDSSRFRKNDIRRCSLKKASLTDVTKAALAKEESKARALFQGRGGRMIGFDGRTGNGFMHGLTMLMSSKPSFQALHDVQDLFANTFATRSLRSMSCVIHPASPFRRCWAICSLLVSVYELFALTMEPFGIMRGQVATVIEWFSAVYWMCDIVANFCSGIYIKGDVEMRFRMIAKHYIKTWFVFDAIVASSQIVALVVDADAANATIILRITRIVRLVRVCRVFVWLKDVLNLSTCALMRGKIILFMLVLYFFVHSVACVLYEVGKADDGWISRYEHRLSDSVTHNYLVSLHWALSQLQGNMDIFPASSRNALLFVVLSSWCSIVALTIFVSSATDTLNDVREQEKRRVDVERLSVEFFHRHDIDPEIRARASHYLEFSEKQHAAMLAQDQDNQALQLFPPKLRSLLLAEMRAFALKWHPLFSYLHEHQTKAFVRLCGVALSLQAYEPNEDVFTTGEVSTNAYFILQGDLVFSAVSDMCVDVASLFLRKDSESSCEARKTSDSPLVTNHRNSLVREASKFDTLVDDEGASVKHIKPVMRIGRGRLISEASLWMPWVHVGDLCSTTHGQCFTVGTDELISVLERHPASFNVFSSYAQRFVLAARMVREESNSDRPVELMDVQTVLDTESRNI